MGPGNSYPGWDSAPGHLRAELNSTMTGRLPSSGAPGGKIYTRQNQDYPGDTDLCFTSGNSETRVRLTPADVKKLYAAAGGLAPNLAALQAAAREAGLSGTVLAAVVTGLVNEAHAAGYALCADDYKAAGEDAGQVADYLNALLDDDGPPVTSADVEAIARVVRFLRGQS